MKTKTARQLTEELGYTVYTGEEINQMKEQERGLFYPDGSFQTDEEIRARREAHFGPFPDKKVSRLDPEEVERVVSLAQRVKSEAEVGQKEATWIPEMEIANRPMLFLFLTDPHYTSVCADHELLNHFLTIARETPNMTIITGGDDIDNFNITLGRIATGMYENPLSPGIQARSWRIKMRELDQQGKIGGMCFGNHTDWFNTIGADWYDTYLADFTCPIFTSGGLLRIRFREGAMYDVAMSHKYWGTSKLNPTNACKRYLEHEYPMADIVLLGHTHQSELLMFERGGKERIGVVGGTLKLYDDYARKHGIGGRAGHPGMCISLWPGHQEMQGYKNFERAVIEHIRRL